MSDKGSSGSVVEVARPDHSTAIAFVLLAVFAGGNAVAVRFSNFGLPPFWGAATRSAAAALIFWGIVIVRRIALPKGRALIGAILYGLVGFGASYAFMYWGLVRIPAGLAGAILALVPLMTLFFAWAHGLETLRWQGLLGALLATAGVVMGVVGGFDGAVHALSLLAVLVGVACVAESAIVFKLFPPSHPAMTNAVALTAGAPPLFILSRLAGEQWSLPSTLSTWAAFAYLVLIGSVVVFTLFLYILSRWTASATSYSFLLMPVATVVIAAWLLGEKITISFLIGAALVLVGVWVGAIHSAPKAVESACAGMPNKGIC